MYKLLNSAEMKQCDRNTIEYYGIPSAVLMERAALAVFAEVSRRIEKNAGRILIVCGSGNNGGDGLAAARLFYLAGYDVEVWIPADKNKMTKPPVDMRFPRQWDRSRIWRMPLW